MHYFYHDDKFCKNFLTKPVEVHDVQVWDTVLDRQN